MSQWGGAPAPLVRESGPPALGGRMLTFLGPVVLRTIVGQLNQQGFGAKVDSWSGEARMSR